LAEFRESVDMLPRANLRHAYPRLLTIKIPLYGVHNHPSTYHTRCFTKSSTYQRNTL